MRDFPNRYITNGPVACNAISKHGIIVYLTILVIPGLSQDSEQAHTFTSRDEVVLIIFHGGREAQMWYRSRVTMTSQRHNFRNIYVGIRTMHSNKGILVT